MAENPGTAAPDQPPRTPGVLARLDAGDVHRAVRALPRNRQQDLARILRVPLTALTEAPTAAALLRRRARRMKRDLLSRLGRDVIAVCAAETVDALGDRAGDPSVDDLLGVLDPIVGAWGTRLVALLLAATVDGDFPARQACEHLLDHDPRFALDALGPEQIDEARRRAGARVRAPEDDGDRATKRDERRRRQEQRARQPTRSARLARPAVRQRYRRRAEAQPPGEEAPAAEPVTPGPPGSGATELPRRRVRVTGRFDGVRYDDLLVGAVVVAFVAFRDPDTGEPGGKHRPCVVIATCSGDRLVVRPCYSEGGRQSRNWRSVRISDPRAAGLDRNGYVSSAEYAVPRSRVTGPIGRLTREDWNML